MTVLENGSEVPVTVQSRDKEETKESKKNIRPIHEYSSNTRVTRFILLSSSDVRD